MHLYPTEIMDNQEDKQEFLGKGSYGQVWKKFDKQLNSFVAIKKISKLLVKRTGKINQVKRQLHALSQITHQNIIKFYGYQQTQSKYQLKMQYFEGKNLRLFFINQYQAIKNNFSHILYFPIKVTLDFINAIIAMREKLISNRDIKLENILVFVDKKNNIHSKMIDFGQSNFNLNALRSQVGTNGYMAPQVYYFSERGYKSDKVDCWSLGRAIFQIFEGLKDNQNFRDPFEDGEFSNFENYYSQDVFNDIIFNKKKTPSIFRNLIRRLLNPNPEERYSFLNLLNHLSEQFESLKIYMSQEEFEKEKYRIIESQIIEKYTQYKKKTIEEMIQVTKSCYELFKQLQMSLPPQNMIKKVKEKEILNILVLLESKIFNNMQQIQKILNVDLDTVFHFFPYSQFTQQSFISLQSSMEAYNTVLGQDWIFQYRGASRQLTNYLLQSFCNQSFEILNKIQKLLKERTI